MNLLRILPLILAAALLPACAASRVPAVDAPPAYHGGELRATLPASLDAVFLATQSALKHLEFRSTDERKDALYARVTAQTADNTEVRVRLDRRADTLTEIRIRAGLFGNEARSRLVLDTITKGL